MDNAPTQVRAIGVSRTLAPDDITVGTLITISRAWFRIYPETTMFGGLEPAEPKAWPRIPITAGHPLRVKAVSLPYVLTENPKGKPQILDTRQYELAALDPEFGVLAFQALTKKTKPKANPSSTPSASGS